MDEDDTTEVYVTVVDVVTDGCDDPSVGFTLSDGIYIFVCILKKGSNILFSVNF